MRTRRTIAVVTGLTAMARFPSYQEKRERKGVQSPDFVSPKSSKKKGSERALSGLSWWR
jgi:hypothetical protein